MNKYAKAMTGHDDVHLPEEDQKKAGQPVAGKVGKDHKKFLEHLFALLDSGEIDPTDAQSLVNRDVYDQLDEEWQDKVDLSLNNMINQVRLIDNFRQANDDVDSVHLHVMVEHLWEMKQRVEEHHDAFKL